ncbi:hypothetical protein Nepgr_006724 [Nepenthes gracilis]|uniref:Uncharacterized protein n=1 Tax=Nepenthes gracilis TaxID=150966 RepID=A0AAD3S5W2_NEPGR|nr:hypothetical protein Nepgr_006724 [Nepenthes gracilis]
MPIANGSPATSTHLGGEHHECGTNGQRLICIGKESHGGLPWIAFSKDKAAAKKLSHHPSGLHHESEADISDPITASSGQLKHTSNPKTANSYHRIDIPPADFAESQQIKSHCSHHASVIQCRTPPVTLQPQSTAASIKSIHDLAKRQDDERNNSSNPLHPRGTAVHRSHRSASTKLPTKTGNNPKKLLLLWAMLLLCCEEQLLMQEFMLLLMFAADAWMIYTWACALLRGASGAWAAEGLLSSANYGMAAGLYWCIGSLLAASKLGDWDLMMLPLASAVINLAVLGPCAFGLDASAVFLMLGMESQSCVKKAGNALLD